MSQTFYTLLTAVGEAKHANAVATGTKVNYSAMAVGDGNGNATLPDRLQTSLVNEVRRAAINQVGIDPDNDAQIIVEQVIPENVGGWWIREVGIFDDDGDLIAVANVPPTYKPQLQEGSGRTQVVRVVLLVSSTAAVAIKIDPSIVLATQQYVNDVFDSIPAASTTELGLVELATIAEAKARADKKRAITPEALGAVLGTYYATFTEITALTADQGPLICTDNHDILYLWDAGAESYKPVSATASKAGTVKLSTTEQAQDLLDDDVAVTPQKLGDAMSAHVLGMGQDWIEVTGQRVANTVYTNTTGRTIAVSMGFQTGPNFVLGAFQIRKSPADTWFNLFNRNTEQSNQGQGVIPPDYQYRATTAFSWWLELR